MSVATALSARPAASRQTVVTVTLRLRARGRERRRTTALANPPAETLARPSIRRPSLMVTLTAHLAAQCN